MADLFQSAGDAARREDALLDRDLVPLLPAVPRLEAAPDVNADLVLANETFDPVKLPAATRSAGLKKLVLRLIQVYTHGQIVWNAAVVRVLNGWDGRLRALLVEMDEHARRADARMATYLTLLDERREVAAARFSGDLDSVASRTSLVEAEISALEMRLLAQEKKLAELEAVVAKAAAAVSAVAPARNVSIAANAAEKPAAPTSVAPVSAPQHLSITATIRSLSSRR